MRLSRLPLLRRVFAINAALLAVATLLLALSPVTIHASIALVRRPGRRRSTVRIRATSLSIASPRMAGSK